MTIDRKMLALIGGAAIIALVGGGAGYVLEKTAETMIATGTFRAVTDAPVLRRHRQPAPTPLVAVKAAEPAAAASAPAPAAPSRARPPAPVNDGPSPSNPAGIRF